jgi:hypothetical protein
MNYPINKKEIIKPIKINKTFQANRINNSLITQNVHQIY